MAKLTHKIDEKMVSFLSADKVNIVNLKSYFLPKLLGSEEPSLTNIRTLVGWNSIDIMHAGKNLLLCSTFTNSTSGGLTYTGHKDINGEIDYISMSGTGTASNLFKNLNYSAGIINWPPDGSYCTYGYSSLANIVFVRDTPTSPKDRDGNNYIETTGKWKTWDLVNSFNTTASHLRIQTAPYDATDVQFDAIIKPFVCIEQDKGCEFEPYKGITYHITFPNNTASYGGYDNELYGGYVDLINGQLVITHGCRKFGTGYTILTTSAIATIETLGDYTRFWIGIGNTSTERKLGTVPICDRLPSNTIAGFLNYSTEAIHFGASDTYLNSVWCIMPTSLVGTTAESIATYLNNSNFQYVYEFGEPKIINISATPLITFIGRNNIWNNTNCNTQVEYEFIDYLIKKHTFVNRYILPPEYKKCTYLLSDGRNTRIDTGVPGNDTTLQIHCEFMPIEYSTSYLYIFGNYKSESANKCWRVIFYSNTNSAYDTNLYVTPGNGAPSGSGVGATTGINSGGSLKNQYITIDMSYGLCTLKGIKTTTITTTNKTVDDNSLNIAISGASPTSTGNAGNHIRFYSFKIKSNGQYIRNYIPVVRKSDNKAGFYDLINHTFNPSIGSVDFIAGND